MMRRLHWIVTLAVAGAGLARWLPAQTTFPPAIEIRVPKPPSVASGDGARLLIYELHVTNFQREAVVLSRVDVLGTGNATIASLADSLLTAMITRPGTQTAAAERTRILPGLRAIVFMWLPVGGSPPASIRHRLTLGQTGADSGKTLTAESGTVAVAAEPPLIGPPLHGGTWLSANGPAAQSGHRRGMVSIDGAMVIAQRFAIDYVKVNDEGRTFDGDRLTNASYLAYGAEAVAVADGSVVGMKEGIPENVPGPTSRAVPITLETVGGNYVILDIGGGRFAFYAHLQPGSIRVKVGDQVRSGQVLGLVGNSGNSTEPHLHFHITDANSPLGAEGVPYVHESYEMVGRCRALLSGCTRENPVTRRREMPFANQMIRFP
jgi:hypothetical protein